MTRPDTWALIVDGAEIFSDQGQSVALRTPVSTRNVPDWWNASYTFGLAAGNMPPSATCSCLNILSRRTYFSTAKIPWRECRQNKPTNIGRTTTTYCVLPRKAPCLRCRSSAYSCSMGNWWLVGLRQFSSAQRLCPWNLRSHRNANPWIFRFNQMIKKHSPRLTMNLGE